MRAILLLTVLVVGLAGCADNNASPSTPTTSAGGTSDSTDVTPREDTKQFTLPPRGSIEWKFRLAEGAPLEYEWTATRPVYFDFHGDYDDGTDEFVSHKEATLASDADAWIAPFDGRHGWYFQNGNTQTITITLHTKGEYEVVGRTGGNTAG